MPKIIKVMEDSFIVGFEDNSMREFRTDTIDFIPLVNKEVELYGDDFDTIVTEVKRQNYMSENRYDRGYSDNRVYQNERAFNNPRVDNRYDELFRQGGNVYHGNVKHVDVENHIVYSNKKIVDKVVYCLLTLFLGIFGVHKFYAGKIVMGIVYLLFFWTGITAIIAFIEFIIALLKQADANGNIAV